MNDNRETLHIVSNDTKSSIDQMYVVTPSIYASVFTQFAKSRNIHIEDEIELSKRLLQLECVSLTKLQFEIAKNIEVLSLSAVKAIGAIKDKDEVRLNDVLKETESLKSEIELLKESLYRDELTGVYNRKWLNDFYLTQDTKQFTNSGLLAILDLNYFKAVNDNYGHIIGDKVLVLIANKLKEKEFKALRYGGDEFILIFPNNVTLEIATKIIDTIREEVLSKKFKAQDSFFRVSFSFGLTLFKKDEYFSSIVDMADKNMYKDKIEIKRRITGIEI